MKFEVPASGFTDKFVRSIPLPKKGQDEGGHKLLSPNGTSLKRRLNLLVSHTGAKAWRIQFYDEGKPKSRKLGYFCKAPGARKFVQMTCDAAYKVALKFDIEPHLQSD